MKNTGVICMVTVPSSDLGEFRHVDLGNFFEYEGEWVLITSKHLAEQYGHLVDVPIYTRRIES